MARKLVYKGPGVSGRSLRACLQWADGVISPEEICEGKLQGAELLIVPGGRDLPYCEALSGVGTQEIRKFVEQGGAYLGICAGAYFGASFVEFAPGTELEVVGERELQFFSGWAKGPLFGGFHYHSEAGARPVLVQVGETSFYAYFNGGCWFEGGSAEEVWGRYEGGKAAILRCPFGEGVAWLSGVHIEYSAENVVPSVPKEIRQALATTDLIKERVIEAILERASTSS